MSGHICKVGFLHWSALGSKRGKEGKKGKTLASFIGSEKWITVFARKENVGKENTSLIPLLFSFPTFSFLASARQTNRYLEYETCQNSEPFLPSLPFFASFASTLAAHCETSF
jgi:hypothetical protein